MIEYANWGDKPVPLIDAESEEYWERAANDELVIQRCEDCGEYQFYPRSVCRNCWSRDLSFKEHDGTGTLYSFTVNHLPGQPGYGDDTPYVVALVELTLPEPNPSGRPVRMTSHIVDTEANNLDVDQLVAVDFKQINDDPKIKLPVFKPA